MIERTLEFAYEGPEDERLDSFLAGNLNGELTRSRLQGLIKEGFVRVNGIIIRKPGFRLKAGSKVWIEIPPPKPLELFPQEVPFDIIYEDPFIAVISKPPGVVVHPAPGNYEGTLVHGLLKRLQDLSSIGGVLRPGIVHRLDKGTSGIMLVAKNDIAHTRISSQLKEGIIKKQYLALAYSKEVVTNGTVDLPLGRDRIHRKKMRIDLSYGKPAFTHYRVLDSKEGVYLLSVRIKTGRTHQIRVHLASKGIKVLGDSLYGLSPPISNKLKPISQLGLNIERTMLHAYRIGFYHPETYKWMIFKAELYQDMSDIVRALYSKDLKEIEDLLQDGDWEEGNSRYTENAI